LTGEHFFLFADKQRKLQMNIQILDWMSSWRTKLQNFSHNEEFRCLFSENSAESDSNVSGVQGGKCLQGKFWFVAETNQVSRCACSWFEVTVSPLFAKLVLDFDWAKELKAQNSQRSRKTLMRSLMLKLPEATTSKNVLLSWKNSFESVPERFFDLEPSASTKRKNALQTAHVASFFYSSLHCVVLQDWLLMKPNADFWTEFIGWNKHVYFLETEKNDLVSGVDSSLSQALSVFLETLEHLKCRLSLYSDRPLLGEFEVEKLIDNSSEVQRILYKDKNGKLRTSLKSFAGKTEQLSWKSILSEKQFDVLMGLLQENLTEVDNDFEKR
jgi:hypothetical protein